MLKNLIKLIITIAIFWYLFRKVDINSVTMHIQKADIPLLLMALFLAFCSTALAAYRWGRVTKILNLASGFKFYMSNYFKGSFFNQALPGSIGGDAVRAIDLHNLGNSWSWSFYAVVIDRLSGLAGLLLINVVAILFLPPFLPKNITLSISLICIGIASVIFVIFLLQKVKFLQKVKILSKAYELSIAFSRVYHNKKETFYQVGLSALVNLFSVLCVFALARAVNLSYDAWYYCALMPPVFLATIIPVSLAGWGVREGAMVTLFAYIGADSSKILTVAMLYGVVAILSSLPGAIVWLREKNAI